MESLTTREGAEEAGQQVEEDRFAARRRLVAADGDADRVERRRRRDFDQALVRRSVSWARRRSMRPNWPARTVAGAAERDRGEATVARSERAQPKRVRARARLRDAGR